MKNLKVPYLLDFYGKLFSDKQQDILDMYFQDDMSLSEIASVMNMSRQGVYDNIKRCEKEILTLEGKLNLMDRFLKISELLDTIDASVEKDKTLNDDSYGQIKDSILKIKQII